MPLKTVIYWAIGSSVAGVPAGWSMYNFTITPAADCLHAGTGAAAGQGLISVSLLDGANVALDKMMVEPGPWGRYQGMHVRKDLAEVFLAQVSFQWKNPDFLSRNPDFLLKNG